MTLPNELRYRPIEEPTERSDLMDVGRRESQRPDRDVERETPPRTTLGMEEP
jgi:hypothetical protein